ncbi:MAG: putative metalloprotease CJM1_0395 family protein [Sulfurimonas sp.]
MEISLNSLYNIGTNYSVKLNEKEALVVGDNPLREDKGFGEKKVSQEEEKRRSEKSKLTNELSLDEKILVQELQSRDVEVRAHEAAHQGAGGGMTGGASFSYQKGPDGRMYAIGGEVSISIPSGSTPQETIRNAQQAIAAAMAPADPSSQDFAVASSAMVMLIKAQQQQAKEIQQEMLGKEAYKESGAKSDEESKSKTQEIDTPA